MLNLIYSHFNTNYKRVPPCHNKRNTSHYAQPVLSALPYHSVNPSSLTDNAYTGSITGNSGFTSNRRRSCCKEYMPDRCASKHKCPMVQSLSTTGLRYCLTDKAWVRCSEKGGYAQGWSLIRVTLLSNHR